jgi:Uma2 family endonuclease
METIAFVIPAKPMTSTIPAKTETLPIEALPMVLRLQPAIALTDDQFFDFCQLNQQWRFERTAHQELVIMSPAGAETGGFNFDMTGQLWAWINLDGTGKGFDSSAGFTLPNGAVRSPDAAWIKKERWDSVPLAARKKFAPICPDFVIELRSESDSLSVLQAKMQEYIDNGALLGWLIDRKQSKVYIYRPNLPIQELNQPATISGDPILPGFILNLATFW